MLAEAIDEGAVDLDLVEREGAEIAERGIACPEIVHRDTHAESSQLVQGLDRRSFRLQEKRLRQLDVEPVGRQARGCERVDDGLQRKTPSELDRREVHGDANVL